MSALKKALLFNLEADLFGFRNGPHGVIEAGRRNSNARRFAFGVLKKEEGNPPRHQNTANDFHGRFGERIEDHEGDQLCGIASVSMPGFVAHV
jgi:hypothetical protein